MMDIFNIWNEDCTDTKLSLCSIHLIKKNSPFINYKLIKLVIYVSFTCVSIKETHLFLIVYSIWSLRLNTSSRFVLFNYEHSWWLQRRSSDEKQLLSYSPEIII